MDSTLTPTPPDQGRFYVYIHVKADGGEPFYVGKGTKNRAWIKQGRSADWIKVAAKHGLVVKIQKHFHDEGEAFASEIETIAILKDLGYVLVNRASGGLGVHGYARPNESSCRMVASREVNCLPKSEVLKVHQLRLQGLPTRKISSLLRIPLGHVTGILSGKYHPDIYKEFHPSAP